MTEYKTENKRVPLNSIVVDHSAQREFRQSWANWLFDNWDEKKAQKPLLSVRDDGTYHCARGQHTVSVRRRQGHKEVEATLIYGLTHEDEVEVCLGDNERLAVAPAEKFRLAAEAQREPELSLRNLLSVHRMDGKFMAFARLRSIAVKTDGMTASDNVLYAATQAWGRDAAAVHANIVAGFGLLFLRREPDRDRLVQELRKVTPETFRASAHDTQVGQGVTAAVAHAEQALRMYNRGLRNDGPNKLATFIK